jgi:amino acid adenylation domain-containing protein
MTEAIGGTDWRPTFHELNAAANRIAHGVLDRCGAGPGAVALILPHDAPLIAAALAVLKAGKTLMVLNPSDPSSRHEQLREDVEAALVLTDEEHRGLALRAGFAEARIMNVAKAPDGSAHPSANIEPSPDDVAFISFTSGSTGRPKGVMQTHRNAVHNALRNVSALGLRPDDRVTLLAQLVTGHGLNACWLSLLNGSAVCPFPLADRGPAPFAAWLAETGVTALVASVAAFRLLVPALDGRRFPAVRIVRLGGDPVLRADFDAYRAHFEDTCLFANAFSATECGTVTTNVVTFDADVGSDAVAVGTPVEGMDFVLLDQHGAEVPAGDVGEIVVRSAYLSPGYWRDEALTAERFVRNGPGTNAGLYHTGDLGCVGMDGALTVEGRKDLRVKIRGSRVEMAEVEGALASRPEVQQAAVCARPAARGGPKLTAYVTAAPGQELSTTSLRRALESRLPRYAVPTEFVPVDALPRTPTGKVDRRRLAQIEPPSPAPGSVEPAIGETEELLADIWSEAFECESVGREEDFFALGGDSLTAGVISARVHAVTGVEFELGVFSDAPTVATMAELVDRRIADATTGARPPLERMPRSQPLPLSFIQERTWEHSRPPHNPAVYVIPQYFPIKGRLDVAAFRRSVDHIVRRHEILRTTFHDRGGRPAQIAEAVESVNVPVIDLRAVPNAEAVADELLVEEARRPMDLERGPLFRLWLVRMGDDEYRLLRLYHHLLSDGWSWRVFFDELRPLYEAFRLGETPPLPDELPFQYADFAAWERRHLRPGTRLWEEHLKWWKEAFRGEARGTQLPFERPSRREDAAPGDGVIEWGFPRELATELDRLGKREGATQYMVGLAGFSALLAHTTRRDDVVLGTYVTTRRLAETYGMFGFFSNLTTLRFRLDHDLAFTDWLARVRTEVIETSARSDVPYSALCEELVGQGVTPPPIRAIFGVSDDLPVQRFGDLEIGHSRGPWVTMPWSFTFAASRRYEQGLCKALFDARTYDPAGVRSFIAGFERLMGRVVAEPDRPLRELF